MSGALAGRRVAVLGAGSWGTGLAILLARCGHAVELWCRDEEQARDVELRRENVRYLPGVKLPSAIRIGPDLARAVASADLIVGAVPSAATRSVARRVAEVLGARARPTWISATKGIERGSRCRMSEVVAAELRSDAIVVLSGPSFAVEVARGEPTAVVVAAADLELARAIQELVSDETFRAYASTDVVGVELGGAFKNVVGIAAGLLAGLGLGHDPLAALVTRGLHEMSKLAVAHGADVRTLAGLSGLGDLVLTCTGALSRNWRLGRAVGEGVSVGEALDALGQVAEGVETAGRMVELAGEHGLEAPVASAVRSVLDEEATPAEAIRRLMTRRLKEELA